MVFGLTAMRPPLHLAHALHQAPAVGRLLAQEVQHEQRQQAGAAQLADERVL